MSDRFISVDVETANEQRSSICQIGLAVFENGEIVEEWSSLINPESYFNPMNIAIHGISEEDVKHSPLITDVKDRLDRYFDRESVIASYSYFDREALLKSNLDLIYKEWIDVMGVVRRTWDDCAYSGYGLKKVSKKLDIDNLEHHQALNDAIVCGKILRTAMQVREYDLDQLIKYSKQTLRYIRKKDGLLPLDGGVSAQTTNQNGHLYGEVVAFTGSMTKPRSQLQSLALGAGCEVKNGVTKKTTILVQGVQDKDKIKGELSNKEKKAIKLIENGLDLKIISEEDFMNILANSPLE